MAQKQKIFLPTFISSINYDAARVLPHIYFFNGTKACEPYYIQNISASAQIQNEFPYFDNYSGNVTTTSSLSLLFNNEAAVYGEAPSASLYSTYWEKYVELLYNPRTRILNCSAIIPLADYFKMDLNDIVQFRGNHYHLRAINNYNLSNGECDLELLGPILGDVLANILPGVQCQFDFDIEDVYYGWRIITCDETPVTYEVTFNTTSSIVPGMIISASSEISGCWTVSGSVTQSSMDYYNVGVYGTYTTCASCSATPPPPPPPVSASISWSFTEINQNGSFRIYDNGSNVVTATSTSIGNLLVANSHIVNTELDAVGFPSSGSVTMSINVNGGTTISTTAYTNTTITASFTANSGSTYYITGSIQWNGAPSTGSVEYQIDNAASGDSASACSGATTTSIVYADPGYTVPFVGMILYDSSALTTPFVGSAGWRKLTGPLDIYAVEIDTDGEITNYVTCP